MPPRRLSSLLILLGSVLNAFSKWYIVWLFARTSGSAAVGEYGTILAFATPLFVVSQLGLRVILVSSTVNYPWRNYLLLRLAGSSFGLMVLFIFSMRADDLTTSLVLAIGILKVADLWLDLYMGRVQYGNRMVLLGGVYVAVAIGTLVATTAAMTFTQRIDACVLSAAGVSALGAVVCRHAGKGALGNIKTPVRAYGPLLSSSLSITVSQFLAALLAQIPIMLLSFHADRATAGIYVSVAYLLVVANLIGSTIQTVQITPYRLLRETTSAALMASTARRDALKVTAAGLPVAATIIVAGPIALPVLYGSEFNISRGPLVFLSAAACVTVAAYILSVALNVTNHYASVTGGMGISCLTCGLVGSALIVFNLEPLLSVSVGVAAGSAARALSMDWFLRRMTR